jgi:hypothetical protein
MEGMLAERHVLVLCVQGEFSPESNFSVFFILRDEVNLK